MFDPEKKPRVPGSVAQILKYRQDHFDPKVGEDEDGFTLRDAEALGWTVDLFHASKVFPGRGLIEVHAGRDVLDSDEGRYGTLKAIYEYELKEHERAKARAQEAFRRLAQQRRMKQEVLSAAFAARGEASSKMSRELRRAIAHTRQVLVHIKELDAFAPLELPEEYIDYLKETKPLDAARRER